MKIGVAGLGYLGTTHALALIKMGHQVVGVDVDSKRIDNLKNGKIGFYEPGLEVILSDALARNQISLYPSFDPTQRVDAWFICVGTPSKNDEDSFNLDALFEAADQIARIIAPETVVVGKSTVPPGTSERLLQKMSEVAGYGVRLAWNPEFLREGTALDDSLNPDRIVIGAFDQSSTELLKKIYEPLIVNGAPLEVVKDIQTAELVKLAANAFLAMKISFMNGIAEIAENCGADASEVSKAIGYDKRIGTHYLGQGLGYGGGCLPKDIRGLVSVAHDLGVDSAVKLLQDVDAINLRRRRRVVALAEEELGDLKGKRILVLGLSFKPNSDDMRDSPALDVALTLSRAGARVTVHDPMALEALGNRHPELIREPDLAAAPQRQNLVILGTDWDEYKRIDPQTWGTQVENRTIIDGRNLLDVPAWQASGWRLIALGRNVHN